MREIVVDSFAGGGGASEGIAAALGRGPHVAINHDPASILMHKANHPKTKHYAKDVWRIHPREVTQGRPVGLGWFSPDCCHFSRAKGAKPVKKEIRSLAWVVCKWAAEVAPRIIILENVREFEDWGPLIQQIRDGVPQVLPDGSPVLVPDPTRKGHSFKRWAGRLRNLGYAVQWRVLNAADYGAPTHRRRLFLVARNDGQSIVWPEATHGDPKKLNDMPLLAAPLKPWRTAAECIDWSIPIASIFMTADEARQWAKDNKSGVPQRPLAENTLRRIALGIQRYVLNAPKPFIVQVNHGGPEFRGQDLGEPLSTVTGKHGYGVVVPHVTKFRGSSIGSGADEPLPTITSGAGSKRPAGAAHALGVVSAFVSRIGQTNGNGKYNHGADEPLSTVTSKAEHLLISPTLIQTGYGERPGQSPRVAAFLAKHFGGVVGTGLDRPTSTATARDHQSLVAANLIHLNHGEKQWNGVDEPLRTATTGNHAALVYSFITKYNRTGFGQDLQDPLRTVTVNDRFGIVTVTIDGELYVIVDIGMRMLSPRELARAQGFPDTYILTGSKSSQVARIGNSVPPVMAEVLCRANYRPMMAGRKAKVS